MIQPINEGSDRSISNIRNFVSKLQDERNRMIHQMKKLKEEESVQLVQHIERTKEQLSSQLHKLREESHILHEREVLFQEKYIKLIEKQLEEKDQIIKELKTKLLQLEADLKKHISGVEAQVLHIEQIASTLGDSEIQMKKMLEIVKLQFDEFTQRINLYLDEAECNHLKMLAN